MFEPLEDYMIQEQEGFVADTEEKALWAIRKLKQLSDRVKEVNKLADDEIARMNMWRESETNSHKESIKFFTDKLEEYHRNVLAFDEERKTINFPHGKLTLWKQAPEYIRDEKLLMDYVRENASDYLKQVVNESVDWERLKKKVKVVGERCIFPTGELLEGIKVVERPEKFTIKLKD